tara:strand:+ start:1393 stop:2472 length:1080 start_codon:yes stop_codon:yes gene_type:complete
MKMIHSLIGLGFFSFSSFISSSLEASHLRESCDNEFSSPHSPVITISSDTPLSAALKGSPLTKSYEEIVGSHTPESDGTQPRSQFPAIIKTGFDRTKTSEEIMKERQRMAFQEMYRAFEERLIREAVQLVPERASSHIDRFNEKMEKLPEGIEDFLPKSLLPYLSRKIFLLKSSSTGDLKRAMISLPRLINEYVGLKPDDTPLDKSQKLGRLGFKLKDSSILGVPSEQMHQLASDAFSMAGYEGKNFALSLDAPSVFPDIYLSSAQSLYWSACLSQDTGTQKILLIDAKKTQELAIPYMNKAPHELYKDLVKTNSDLEAKINLAQEYLEIKKVSPSLPSLYAWNNMISSFANAFKSAPL